MSATVVMVVHGEPVDRLARAFAAIAAQEGVEPLTVIVAVPAAEHGGLDAFTPVGAIGAVHLVDNPGGARSAGLNRAVAAAPHDVVVRVDARSQIPSGYVAACVQRLAADPEVGVVGGVQWPCSPHEAGPAAAGIARALRNPWLLGNAAYRRPDASGPVDTVYLGAFRREELVGLGGYDEDLDANEDFDLAQRYRDAGRVVWLERGLVVPYEPRDQLDALARQYHAFGEAKVRFWRRTGSSPNRRQQIALAGGLVGAVVGLLALRRPVRAIALVLTAIAGVAVLDHTADPGERDPRVRAGACVAGVVIVAGWLSGIATGLLRGRRDLR